MVIDKNFNPLENGYTFPAEWEEHEATWLSWPHKEESWPERIDLIYPAYAQFIAELTKGEFVCINVKDQKCRLSQWNIFQKQERYFQSRILFPRNQ
jgi:agmatine deiminase